MDTLILVMAVTLVMVLVLLGTRAIARAWSRRSWRAWDGFRGDVAMPSRGDRRIRRRGR